MAVLLITEPSGARLPCGKVTVGGETGAGGAGRVHDHIAWIDAVTLLQYAAQLRAARGSFPPIERGVQRLAADREDARFQQAGGLPQGNQSSTLVVAENTTSRKTSKPTDSMI